jgi:hypothetical protein
MRYDDSYRTCIDEAHLPSRIGGYSRREQFAATEFRDMPRYDRLVERRKRESENYHADTEIDEKGPVPHRPALRNTTVGET